MLSKFFTLSALVLALCPPSHAENALTVVIKLGAESKLSDQGHVLPMTYGEKRDCATELAKLILKRYKTGLFVVDTASKEPSLAGITGGTAYYKFRFTDGSGRDGNRGWMYVNFENRINPASGRRYAYACAVTESKRAGYLYNEAASAGEYFDNVNGSPSALYGD